MFFGEQYGADHPSDKYITRQFNIYFHNTIVWVLLIASLHIFMQEERIKNFLFTQKYSLGVVIDLGWI